MNKKLFCVGMILLFLLCGVSSAFATNAKAGETWVYAYQIVWQDTGEVVDKSIGFKTFDSDTRNIEREIAKSLGFKYDSMFEIYSRVVSGKYQRLNFTSLAVQK